MSQRRNQNDHHSSALFDRVDLDKCGIGGEMKVRHADNSSVIVELSFGEFRGITGVQLKTSDRNEYADGLYPRQIVEKDYELDQAIEAYYSLKVVHELNKRISEDLDSLKNRLNEAMWPIPEYKTIKPKEIK